MPTRRALLPSLREHAHATSPAKAASVVTVDFDQRQLRVRSWPAPRRIDMAIRGELDLASGEHLKREAHAALDRGCDISLDLAEVSFLDCGGLHALQDVCTAAAHRGLHAVVRSPITSGNSG